MEEKSLLYACSNAFSMARSSADMMLLWRVIRQDEAKFIDGTQKAEDADPSSRRDPSV